MPRDILVGYHEITKELVNVWYTSEKTGHKMRVVGVRDHWRICDLDDNSRWLNEVEYDHYTHAIREFP